MPLERWVVILITVGTSIGGVIIAIDIWVHKKSRDIDDHDRRLRDLEEEADADRADVKELKQIAEAEGKAIRFLIAKANETFSQKSSEMQTRCGQMELMLNTLNTLEGERRTRGGNKR